MTTLNFKCEIFGSVNDNGTISILHEEDGSRVTQLDDSHPTVWPLDSNVCAQYDHINGLIVSQQDAKLLGLEIHQF